MQKVFVGGNIGGYEKHREVVEKVIRDLGMIPIMDLPKGGEILKTIQDQINEASVFVSVMGRFGAMPETAPEGTRQGEPKPYNELEYIWARRRNIPCLVYFTNEQHAPTDRIFANGHANDKFVEFRREVWQQIVVDTFLSPEDLKEKLTTELARYVLPPVVLGTQPVNQPPTQGAAPSVNDPSKSPETNNQDILPPSQTPPATPVPAVINQPSEQAGTTGGNDPSKKPDGANKEEKPAPAPSEISSDQLTILTFILGIVLGAATIAALNNPISILFFTAVYAVLFIVCLVLIARIREQRQMLKWFASALITTIVILLLYVGLYVTLINPPENAADTNQAATAETTEVP